MAGQYKVIYATDAYELEKFLNDPEYTNYHINKMVVNQYSEAGIGIHPTVDSIYVVMERD